MPIFCQKLLPTFLPGVIWSLQHRGGYTYLIRTWPVIIILIRNMFHILILQLFLQNKNQHVILVVNLSYNFFLPEYVLIKIFFYLEYFQSRRWRGKTVAPGLCPAIFWGWKKHITQIHILSRTSPKFLPTNPHFRFLFLQWCCRCEAIKPSQTWASLFTNRNIYYATAILEQWILWSRQ